jgi:hypothetical protein
MSDLVLDALHTALLAGGPKPPLLLRTTLELARRASDQQLLLLLAGLPETPLDVLEALLAKGSGTTDAQVLAAALVHPALPVATALRRLRAERSVPALIAVAAADNLPGPLLTHLAARNVAGAPGTRLLVRVALNPATPDEGLRLVADRAEDPAAAPDLREALSTALREVMHDRPALRAHLAVRTTDPATALSLLIAVPPPAEKPTDRMLGLLLAPLRATTGPLTDAEAYVVGNLLEATALAASARDQLIALAQARPWQSSPYREMIGRNVRQPAEPPRPRSAQLAQAATLCDPTELVELADGTVDQDVVLAVIANRALGDREAAQLAVRKLGEDLRPALLARPGREFAAALAIKSTRTYAVTEDPVATALAAMALRHQVTSVPMGPSSATWNWWLTTLAVVPASRRRELAWPVLVDAAGSFPELRTELLAVLTELTAHSGAADLLARLAQDFTGSAAELVSAVTGALSDAA